MHGKPHHQAKQIKESVKKGTDLEDKDLQASLVKLINSNYKLIIEELVKRNKLKQA